VLTRHFEGLVPSWGGWRLPGSHGGDTPWQQPGGPSGCPAGRRRNAGSRCAVFMVTPAPYTVGEVHRL